MKTKTKKDSNPKKPATEFTLLAPQARSVFLSGDFNDWSVSSHPLKKDKGGMWKIAVSLAPGQYQYRFWVDGEWQNDPNSSECVSNPFGTMNCLKSVS